MPGFAFGARPHYGVLDMVMKGRGLLIGAVRTSNGCIVIALALLYGLPEQVFNLPVDATQVIRRPGFQFVPELGINAQQKRFSFFHDVL